MLQARHEINRLEQELRDVQAEFASYRAEVDPLVDLVSAINAPSRTAALLDGAAMSVEVLVLMVDPAHTSFDIVVAAPLEAELDTVLIFPSGQAITFTFAASDDPNCEQTEAASVCTYRLPALEGQLPGIWRVQLLRSGGPAFEASLSVVLGRS